MNLHLQNRDVLLLLDLYKYRYLSFSQLTKLHFSSTKTAYRRLHGLTTLNYLKAFHAPNIPERIFYLDKEGAEIVAGQLHVAVEELKWYRYIKAPKDYNFLRHFLAINDFRILITQACLDSPITLLGFIPEYFGEKTVQGNVRKYIRDRVCDISNQTLQYSYTPDAVFALGKGENAALFFLEIDLGGEIVSDPEKGLLKSIVFYLNYWVSGKYQRYQSDFGGRQFKNFRTLIATTSHERLRNIREAVTKLSFTPPNAKRFLWGTTHGQLTQQTLFEPVWNSLDAGDHMLYRIG
jgi:Replication-relaxation